MVQQHKSCRNAIYLLMLPLTVHHQRKARQGIKQRMGRKAGADAKAWRDADYGLSSPILFRLMSYVTKMISLNPRLWVLSWYLLRKIFKDGYFGGILPNNLPSFQMSIFCVSGWDKSSQKKTDPLPTPSNLSPHSWGNGGRGGWNSVICNRYIKIETRLARHYRADTHMNSEWL